MAFVVVGVVLGKKKPFIDAESTSDFQHALTSFAREQCENGNSDWAYVYDAEANVGAECRYAGPLRALGL